MQSTDGVTTMPIIVSNREATPNTESIFRRHQDNRKNNIPIDYERHSYMMRKSQPGRSREVYEEIEQNKSFYQGLVQKYGKNKNNIHRH